MQANMIPIQKKTSGSAPASDDQERRQSLAQKKRADAESHHHDAGGQPLAVGKPLGDRGDRRHVSEADPGAADHPLAQVEKGDQIELERRTRDQVAAGEHDAAGQGQYPGPQPGQHASRPGRRTPSEKMAMLNAQAV